MWIFLISLAWTIKDIFIRKLKDFFFCVTEKIGFTRLNFKLNFPFNISKTFEHITIFHVFWVYIVMSNITPNIFSSSSHRGHKDKYT